MAHKTTAFPFVCRSLHFATATPLLSVQTPRRLSERNALNRRSGYHFFKQKIDEVN